jgi:hypothetical protein
MFCSQFIFQSKQLRKKYIISCIDPMHMFIIFLWSLPFSLAVFVAAAVAVVAVGTVAVIVVVSVEAVVVVVTVTLAVIVAAVTEAVAVELVTVTFVTVESAVISSCSDCSRTCGCQQ